MFMAQANRTGAGRLIDANPTAAAPLLAYTHQPSEAPLAYGCAPVSIISPQFCSSQPVDLAIVRQVLTLSDGNFVVNDVINGSPIFKVKGSFFTLRSHRLLLDTAGSPIITLRRKLSSAHLRWKVFRGDSTESKDLIFSAKKSSVLQLSTKLDVYLAHNVTEKAPDFKVKGSWSERSCIIYAGNSSTMVAQMHKKTTVKSFFLGKDNFKVTVYPGIDYAFIIALIVILDEINSEGRS